MSNEKQTESIAKKKKKLHFHADLTHFIPQANNFLTSLKILLLGIRSISQAKNCLGPNKNCNACLKFFCGKMQKNQSRSRVFFDLQLETRKVETCICNYASDDGI